MKILVGLDLGGYSFDAIAKTVTLTGLNPVALEQVLLITNVTTNTVIYLFNKVGFGGTIAANVITLDYDTASMSNSDNLQIFIEYEIQPLSVITANPSGTFINGSGTIILGGTSQEIFAANANRRFLFIQNQNGLTSMWINFGTAAVATQPSIEIAPKGFFSMVNFINTASVNIIGATTGMVFTAKQA